MHECSSTQPHKNKVDEPAASAPSPQRPITTPRITWETIVPNHTPFSSNPTPKKIRETTSAAHAHALVSPMAEGLSLKKLHSHASASTEWATKEDGRSCHSPSSPNMPGIAQTAKKSEVTLQVDQPTSARSADEPPSRKEVPKALPSSQEVNAPTTPTYPDPNPDHDNTSPTSRIIYERQEGPQTEKQTLLPKSDSVEWTAGRPDLLESRGLRYHDYRIRRKVMWSWTSVMFGRLGAKAEDADGSICSEDTSDSEYVPSEISDTEREDESEAASDSAREEAWESQFDHISHKTRQVESNSQSECGISEYHDNGEQDESGSGSSEFWETEDEGEEMQDDSESGSSDLWDDEAGCHTVPDSSEGEQSVYGDNTDPDTASSAPTGDEDDRISTNTGRYARRHHPRRGKLLKGVDLERLRSMAMSTLPGIDFSELSLIQSVIQTPVRVPSAWNVGFWCHREFDPKPSKIRDTLVRDLNKCSALYRGEDYNIARVNAADLLFEELRCSPFKEKLSIWFADEDSDAEVQRRICMNLIRLTEAPYCARVLRYVGLEDSCEFWSRLEEEALGYIYGCRRSFIS